MAGGRKRSGDKQARRNARRHKARRRDVEREAPEEVSLVDEIREALDAGDPLSLLGLASTVIAALTAHRGAPALLQPDDDMPDLDEVVASFIDTELPETTAILAAFAELLPDAAMRAECHDAVATRDDDLPGWLADLKQTTVYRAVVMSHVLGDASEVLVAVRLADGQELTCAAHVDHLMTSALSDAFFVPQPIATVLGVADASAVDSDTTFTDIDLADAAATLQEALEVNSIFGISDESDTWPSSQALVEWLVRVMPDGGTNVRAIGWDASQLAETFDRFFGSLVGMAFDDPEHRELLESLVIEGTGDPLRWSAPRVAQLLEWDVYYDEDLSLQVQLDTPNLLKAYVPFAHAQSGIRQELTVEAVDAIDSLAEAYAVAVVERSEALKHID